MATVYESYTTGADSSQLISDQWRTGQTFTPAANHTIEKVRLLLFRVNSPGTLNVYIYATSAGLPTGAALASGTTNGNTLTTNTNGSYRDILLGAGAALTSGIQYAIVAEAPDGTPTVDEAYWRMDSTSPTYAGGTTVRRPTFPGEVDEWESYSGKDCLFVEYGFDVPSKATTPSPANDATGVDFSAFGLSWVDGGNADTYDVWIGPVGSLVKVSSAQVGTSYTTQLSECATGAKTYWRIDSTNTGGTTTGDTWNFDPRPVAATTPSPTDSATDITLDETPLSWVDGGNADTYEIYYRAQGDSWVLVGVSQAGITWAIPFGNIAYGITYEWRIDATNQFGLTTGTTWSFDAVVFDQIRISYRLISGGNGNGPYDSTPGVQGTDWEYTGESNTITVKRLVAAANSTIWYESI